VEFVKNNGNFSSKLKRKEAVMGKAIRFTTKVSGILVLLVPLMLGIMLVTKAYAPSGNLGITVSKECEDAVAPGSPIFFNGVVANTGTIPLSVTVTDDHAGLVFGPTIIDPSSSEPYSGSYVPTVTPSTNIVTATGTPYYDGKLWPGYAIQAFATATCETNGMGYEGCTPGFWKQHLDLWAAAGYRTSDDFDTVFGTDFFNPNITLLRAINLGGGGLNKLARHGTAALLSAAHAGVDYPLSVAQVIAAVQARDADTLAGYNELGCPLK
jgi:hypothetical protein